MIIIHHINVSEKLKGQVVYHLLFTRIGGNAPGVGGVVYD